MATMVSQDARAAGTASIFAEVGFSRGQAAVTEISPTREAAEAAIARLREMSADLRGCAVIGRDGEVLAATGNPDRWQQAAAVLLGAADLAGDEAAEHVHVGTEDGEVFAVRHRGLAMVA